MIKLNWYCVNCDKGGPVEDPSIIVGQCPICGCHHGEVEYECTMSEEEFIAEYNAMPVEKRRKYAYAIQICEDQFGITL